ncbi:hypothetical protein M0R04_05840 [Candidatus Dojkabacteria bacterium]|jgi:hypothetical protein|nr:hypothetical protein [Candidatus Dojkabacteria bacterium]
MATKGRAYGYGSGESGYAAKNVFKVDFNHPLSSKVRYETYDNNAIFPATDTAVSTVNDIFGMSAAEKSMIALMDTSNGTGDCGTTWFPTNYAATNTGTTNLMVGIAHYVTQQSATLDSFGGGSIYFNMQVKVVASMQTSSSAGFDLLLRYSFISTTPTVSWFFNQVAPSTAGTEAAPVWATIPSGSMGIVHCRENTPFAGPYLANIPETGQEKTQEGWITD